jgi:hypothetical protein
MACQKVHGLWNGHGYTQHKQKERAQMETTTTINDQLVELGTLANNQDNTIQRAGAEMIEAFFNTHNEGDNVSENTVAQLLFYLTEIQVRDYALGLIDPATPDKFRPALSLLLEAAPTDTEYINAPACLFAALEYEQDNKKDAFIMLSNASEDYSLAKLLTRVFTANWPATAFGNMRNELHPKVTAGIFGGK